jgi:aspartyl-tRNA synthetase
LVESRFNAALANQPPLGALNCFRNSWVCARPLVMHLGLERLVLYMTGMENIRDVIPFPRVPHNASF